MPDSEHSHGGDRVVGGVHRGREGPFRGLQVEVGRRARRGEALAQIDDEVIAPSALSEDDKSALWLYGWAYQEGGKRRYEDRQAQVRRQGARLASLARVRGSE